MSQLNEGQILAKRKLLAFLFDPKQKYFCIDSMPGMGKTFLLNDIQADLKSMNQQLNFLGNSTYDKMVFAAPTNKAASLIAGESIHKLFKLSLFPNYKTGKMVTKTSSKTVNLSNQIVVIDEASMIEPKIGDIIDQYTQGSKVIYIGDSYQLAPVGYEKPVVFSQGYPTAELTEPMRFPKDSHIFQQCLSLRDQVQNQYVSPFVEGEGITIVEGSTFMEDIVETFRKGENSRVLCYTNNQAESINKYIRKKLHGNDMFAVGDPVVVATSHLGLSVEDSHTITEISDKPINDGTMDTYKVKLDNGTTYTIPANKHEYFALVKRVQAQAKQDGDWSMHFQIQERYLDIRDAFASTVAKSQGSTYDKVFIDYPNISTCQDLNTFLRMRNVALSRASKEVIIYDK